MGRSARPPGSAPREDHGALSAASHKAARTAPYATSGVGLSLWPRVSMIARCGCRRARPPHPDVSVALRMRGRRLCHSNRSVNGSNGNGGCLQCRRGRLAGRALGLQAWRPAERALGWPGAWGEAEPGRPRDLAVAGEGRHEDRACSGMGGTGAAPRARRGGRGWGACERRSLRAAPEQSSGTGCGNAAAPVPRERHRGAEPFAARGFSELVSGPSSPGMA